MKRTENPPDGATLTDQRLDSWLWAARFFKTRKLSCQAITGGHVRLNEQKSKPGKSIRVGDQLRINKQHQEFNITVTGLSVRRLSAPQAALLYEEPEWSVIKRQQEGQLRRQAHLGVRYEQNRPDRRDRRIARQIKQQSGNDIDQ